MSQPDFESVSVPSVVVKKPQMTVYTVMLIVALVSLLMACLFLYLEIRAYGGLFQVRLTEVIPPMVPDAAAVFWA